MYLYVLVLRSQIKSSYCIALHSIVVFLLIVITPDSHIELFRLFVSLANFVKWSHGHGVCFYFN